jgi:hypothetical protein
MVKSLKWENLEDRRKSARLSMLFKILHDLIDIDRQQYLTLSDSRLYKLFTFKIIPNLQLKLCTLYVAHFLPVLDFRAALNPSIVSADIKHAI